MEKKPIILSVDDSPANNKLIEAYFHRDYIVISAESGQAAFKWLEKNIPDVILLDILLPILSGLDVLESLVNNERLKDIPIIIVSAKTEMESIKKTLSIGALDYVKKPIDFTELQSKIMLALQFKRRNKEIRKYKTYYNIHQGMIHAQRIQRSVLPDAESFYRLFPQAFIINQPKHIISGDFYWIHKNSGQKQLALFDCTGHGVPAAMLTMMAQVELHNITDKSTVIKANHILSSLSRKFGSFLNSSNDTYTHYEGMDGIICTLYPGENRMEFAGAKRSLTLIREKANLLRCNNETIEARYQHNNYYLFEIPGDRYSIEKESEHKEFTLNTIETIPGDRIFLFTDGITDQLGGHQVKRLKRGQFYEKLLEFQSESITDQKSVIFDYFENWKENNEQTDDILIIGVELQESLS